MPALRQPVWQRTLQRAWLRRGWLARLLWPLSWPLHLLVRLRQGCYRLGLCRTEGVEVPVIVVGNVVAGGAGKTPVVMALIRHLRAQGLHCGVVSRGYGRRTRDCREVLGDSLAGEVGDEPLLIRRVTGVPVFVAKRRIDAARELLARHPATDVLICDDGLQHLALRRDIEICVFDERGLGNGWLLPAGPLREPWPRPADGILLSAPVAGIDGFRVQRNLQTWAHRADGTRIALVDLAHAGSAPLLAVAGIARPEAFFDMLRARGLPLAQTIALPDHADFSRWSPPTDRPCTLLCTEKDAVKLWPRFPLALAVGLDLTLDPRFLDLVDAKLAELRSAKLSSRHGHTIA